MDSLVMPVVENRRQHRRRIIWVRLLDSETVNELAVLNNHPKIFIGL